MTGHDLSFRMFLPFLKFPKGLKEGLPKVLSAACSPQLLPYSNFCLISHSNSDAVLTAAVLGFHELLIIFPHQIAFIALKYPGQCLVQLLPGDTIW